MRSAGPRLCDVSGLSRKELPHIFLRTTVSKRKAIGKRLASGDSDRLVAISIGHRHSKSPIVAAIVDSMGEMAITLLGPARGALAKSH